MEVEQLSDEENQKIREEMSAEVFEGKAPEPAAEPEKQETDKPIVKEPENKEPEEDPWAGVPAALRTQIEGISNRLSGLDNIENRLKQTERRIGSIQNEFQNAAKAAKEVKDSPTKEEMAAAAKTEEAWENLKDEFPDWADAIDSRLSAKGAELQKNIPDVTDLREGIKGIQGTMLTPEALEVRLVAFKHPDWNTVRVSPEYKTWLSEQPRDIQEKHATGKTAEEAIYVLDKFKGFQKSKTDDKTLQKQKRLESAITPQSSKKTPVIKSEADMTEQEIRKLEEKRLWG